jgi:hypothetical protein
LAEGVAEWEIFHIQEQPIACTLTLLIDFCFHWLPNSNLTRQVQLRLSHSMATEMATHEFIIVRLEMRDE